MKHERDWLTVNGSATDQDGTVTDGTADFVLGETDFRLRDGESVTFTDLPGGLQFAVTESAQDAAGYQTTFTVNDGSAVSGRVATGTLAVNPTVAFRNTRQQVIPSGVTETVQFAWLLPPLLYGGVLLLKRKRRDEEADGTARD